MFDNILHKWFVTLSTDDNITILKSLKQGFKAKVSRNKYRSEITTLSENNNFDYLIHPTFRNTNRFFVLSLKMVRMILWEVTVISITCYYRNQWF